MWVEVNLLVARQLDLSQCYFVTYHCDALPVVNLDGTSLETGAEVYAAVGAELAAHCVVIGYELGDNHTRQPMDVHRVVASILADADRKSEVGLGECLLHKSYKETVFFTGCLLHPQTCGLRRMQAFRMLRTTSKAITGLAMPFFADKAAEQQLNAALKPMFRGAPANRGMFNASEFPGQLNAIIAALPAGMDADSIDKVNQSSNLSMHACLVCTIRCTQATPCLPFRRSVANLTHVEQQCKHSAWTGLAISPCKATILNTCGCKA